MKVGVIGGTGNISRSFVNLLLQRGHDVVCFNRGKMGPVPAGARAVQCDRKADPAGFEHAVQAEKFDAVIDMICFTREEAESTYRACRGVGHLVHCSTTCTYGVEYDWLPVTEDHPLRPVTAYGRDKAAADAFYMEAYYREGFPITIIKPSSTYGPMLGTIRQIAWDFSWIDRIRKGKPLVVCGDGLAIHQMLHVDDAAVGFVGVLGRSRCFGQTYNLVGSDFFTWVEHHRRAMKVVGREVDLIGVPLADLIALEVPEIGICRDIYAYNTYYSNAKLLRDVPEFCPKISLEEGFCSVWESMDHWKRIPNSDELKWEDNLIAAQRQIRSVTI